MISRDTLLNLFTGLALAGSLTTAVVVVKDRAKPASDPRAPQPPRPVKEWKRYIDTDHLLGSPAAPVVVVEFADFQCPACKSIEPEVQRLLKKYPGKFAVSYRYAPLPYHQYAYTAARAAECARTQGRFEAYHDALFNNFAGIDSGRVSFISLATQAGVADTVQFATCMNSTALVPKVDADKALAFDTLRIQGTPSFIVDGKLYSPMPTDAEFNAIIQAGSVERTSATAGNRR